MELDRSSLKTARGATGLMTVIRSDGPSRDKEGVY